MATSTENVIISDGTDRKKGAQERQNAKHQSFQILLFCLNRHVFVANLSDRGEFGIIP